MPTIADAARQAAENADKDRESGPKRSAHSGTVKKSNVPTAMRKRSNQYAANITKRGYAAAEKAKKEDGPALSPWIVYLFIFIIVGSAIFQVISTATGKKLFD